MAKDKSGRTLEMAVARLQQMFDPNSTVTRKEWIVDRLGIRREFDVVIRGKAVGRDFLGVIECKDWADKVGTPEVEAFVMKARNINANFILIVSRNGFTQTGLHLAKFEGVGTLSLLPDDPDDEGLRIGVIVYAKYYRWTQLELMLHLLDVARPIPPFEYEGVVLRGKQVSHWFEKQLATTYANLMNEGVIRLGVQFREPQLMQVDGVDRRVEAISMNATRAMLKKKRFVRLAGDLFYDWHSSLGHIPAGGEVATEGFAPTFGSWDDFDGDLEEIMNPGLQLFTLCFHAVEVQYEDRADVIDLGALA